MSKIKLGDVTKIRTGKLDANASSENGKYPFFTCSKEPLRIDSYSYDCECVLVAGNGDLNVKYYKGKFDAYQRTYIIEDNSNGRLFIPYLYYFLELYVEELRKQSIGGVIKYIKLGNLTDAIIELPSIEKQKEIVNILNKSRKIVESKNVLLQSYDQLIKSRFVEMFGDPLTNTKKFDINNCKELLTKIGSGATPNGGNESYIDEGISLIRSMNVYNNRFDFKGLAHISEDQAYQLKNVTVEANDMLFNITGASVTRCCKVPNNVLPARVNQHVSILRCGNRIIPDFLEYLFTNDTFQQYLMSLAISNGATREAITKQQIEKIEIICPPVTLQNQFANFVQQVDKLKFVIQKSLDETQTLFNSLMQKHFG